MVGLPAASCRSRPRRSSAVAWVAASHARHSVLCFGEEDGVPRRADHPTEHVPQHFRRELAELRTPPASHGRKVQRRRASSSFRHRSAARPSRRRPTRRPSTAPSRRSPRRPDRLLDSPGDQRSAEGPRGRGGEGARARAAGALRGVARVLTAIRFPRRAALTTGRRWVGELSARSRSRGSARWSARGPNLVGPATPFLSEIDQIRV